MQELLIIPHKTVLEQQDNGKQSQQRSEIPTAGHRNNLVRHHPDPRKMSAGKQPETCSSVLTQEPPPGTGITEVRAMASWGSYAIQVH